MSLPISSESQALREHIAAYWDQRPIPCPIIDYYGYEELELEAFFLGKSWREVDFWDCPSESIFISLNVPAQAYYLGALLMHVMELRDRCDAEWKAYVPEPTRDLSQDPAAFLDPSFWLIALTCALRLADGFHRDFAEAIALQPECFRLVRDFVSYVYTHPGIRAEEPVESDLILKIWSSVEALSEHLAALPTERPALRPPDSRPTKD